MEDSREDHSMRFWHNCIQHRGSQGVVHTPAGPPWQTAALACLPAPYPGAGKIPPSYKAEVPDVLSFTNRCLHPDNSTLLPRDDYREFLELAKMILGREAPTPFIDQEHMTMLAGWVRPSTPWKSLFLSHSSRLYHGTGRSSWRRCPSS